MKLHALADAKPRCRTIMAGRYLHAAPSWARGNRLLTPAPDMHAALMAEPGQRQHLRLWHWLGVALILYLVPAAVFVLDGAFLSSHLWHALSPKAQHFVNAIYFAHLLHRLIGCAFL